MLSKCPSRYYSPRHLPEYVGKMLVLVMMTLLHHVSLCPHLENCRVITRELTQRRRNAKHQNHNHYKHIFTVTFGSTEPWRCDKFHKFTAIFANADSRRSARMMKQLNSSSARADCLSNWSVDPRCLRWLKISSTIFEQILLTSPMNFWSDPYNLSFEST